MLKKAEPIPGGLRVTADVGQGTFDGDVDATKQHSAPFRMAPAWGDHHGATSVTPNSGGSPVAIGLHTTERVDPDQAEQALDYALARIRERASRAPMGPSYR
jgi:hypothetical protein